MRALLSICIAACFAAAQPLRDTPVVQCGAVLRRNTSFMSSDEDDYWVTVNASAFVLVATRYGVSPSSWSCDPSVQIVAAPDGQGDWAPVEQGYGDGDSFNFTVGPWNPPATSADIFFSGGLCDYVLTMEETRIVCPPSPVPATGMEAAATATVTAAAPAASIPAPSAPQRALLAHTFTAFHHFSLCTFTDCQWDTATAPPSAFAPPDDMNTDQWLETDALMGATQACLTVRHVDGFALWPTATTNYSVSSSPWRGGHGDVARDFVASARKYGISPCFYIILGFNFEANHSGVPGDVYLAQQVTALTELLTSYGQIDRLWWDNYAIGCCQPVTHAGFYCPGGGTTSSPSPACPSWQVLIDTVRSVSPLTAMMPGPDGCLVNGESFGGTYPLYHASTDPLSSYSCTRDSTVPTSTGATFLLAESDFTLLEPGDAWFWTPSHAFLNATAIAQQVDAKLGAGAHLILNVPPNSSGVIPAEYVVQLTAFADARAATYATPAAQLTSPVSAPCEGLSVVIPVTGTFDRLVSEEDMSSGQVIGGYTVEARRSDGAWHLLSVRGVTVGNRVTDVFATPLTDVSALRWNCTRDLAPPAPPTPATFESAGGCLGMPAETFPCWSGSAVPGGPVFHLCPLVATPCAGATEWLVGADGSWSPTSTPSARINIDCDSCAIGTHAKVMLEDTSPLAWDAAAQQITVGGCSGMCLTTGVSAGAHGSCAGNETWYPTQVHVDACTAASTKGWRRSGGWSAAPSPIATLKALVAVLTVQP